MRKLKSRFLGSVRKLLGEDSGFERLLHDLTRRMSARRKAGTDTVVEQKTRLWVAATKGKKNRRFGGGQYTVMWSDSLRDPRRTGLYAKGGCDLPAIFAAAPRLQSSIEGVCGMYVEPGGVSTSRSDILLQTLDIDSPKAAAYLVEELALPTQYFEPNLFQPRFTIPGYGALGEFEKSAVVLSIGADVVRTAYRHRESGLLVDPGGWWLNQDMAYVLANLEKVNWFKENFEDVGKVTIGEFGENFAKIIRLLQEDVTPNIAVLNLLEVEPGDSTHTYQLVKSPAMERRRTFNLALMEMSRELQFSVVDVDRILKEQGVESQVDFAHYTHEAFQPLAREISAVLGEMGIFRTGSESSSPVRATTG